jgi:hypothetical protein
LVVAWVFLIAHLLQMPGIRRPTALIIVAIVAMYLCFHFYTLPPLAAEDPQKATTLAGYASNFSASLAMFWVGPPRDGIWSNAFRFIGEPWQWVQIAAGIAVLLLLFGGWLLAPSGAERDAHDAPPLDRRWFILFVAALCACAALSFYYPRHRHGAPAIPLLAYCTYLSLRMLLWRLDNLRGQIEIRRPYVLSFAVLAGLVCALLFPLRVVTGFEFLRSLGGWSKANWHDKMPAFWTKVGSEHQPFLLPVSESVDMVPWPRRDVPIFRFLGRRPYKSVNF